MNANLDTNLDTNELTPEVEEQILSLYKSGDRKKMDKALIIYHKAIQKLLASAITRIVGISRSDIDFEDYCSEAKIIALNALSDYNPELVEAETGRKALLSTYLYGALKNGLVNAKAKARGETPHYTRAASSIYKAMTQIADEKGLDIQQIPDPQISEATGLSLATVKRTREGMVSVNQTDPDEAFLMVQGPKEWEPERWLVTHDVEDRFQKGLGELSEIERFIFVTKAMLDEPWSNAKLIKELQRRGHPIHSPAQIENILERARRKMAEFFPERKLDTSSQSNRRARVQPKRRRYEE